MKLIIPGPNEKQEAFFTAKAKYVAYGGARGGGKSWALRRKLELMCMRYRGLRALLVRRTYGELHENHVRALLCDLRGLAEYSESKKSFAFRNGSVLKLGYCDREADVMRYQGQEYDVIALDEATQLTEFQFQTFKAVLRGANSLPKRMYLTCNPGGVGHAWVKRLFVDREYDAARGERGEDYMFIPARLSDNAALMRRDPGYAGRLASLPEQLRDAWLNGRWDVFAGQYFSEFDYTAHTKAPRGPLPDERVYAALDYGLDMLAVVFVALDGAGHAFVFDEICQSGLIVSKAAECILQKAANWRVERYIAPPDLHARAKDTGKDIAALFWEHGVYLDRQRSGREEGWLALKERLAAGSDGLPGLTIGRNCVNLIRCLPALRRDDDNPCDCSRAPHEITHITDALRYFAISGACPPPAGTGQPGKRVKLVDRVRGS